MNARRVHILILILFASVTVLSTPILEEQEWDLPFAFLLILLTGVPHGAFDHHVARFKKQKFSLFSFLVKYLLLASLVLLFWIYVPTLAMIFFLAMTAWHFGETDAQALPLFFKNKSILFLFGSLLLFWILSQDSNLLLLWINRVIGENNETFSFIGHIEDIHLFIAYVSICLIVLFKSSNRELLDRIFYLLFLFLLSKTNLILGFTIYFCGWHSLITLGLIKSSVFKTSSKKKMILYSLPIMLGAISLLILVNILRENTWLKEHALTSVFVLLSILTLPHLIEMNRLYIKLSKQ